MSQPKRRKFRLNVRAASILGIGLVVAISGFIVLSYVATEWKQPALLTQALQQAAAKPPKYDVALMYLNEYLVSHPNDPVALESKAKILAEIASNGDQLGEAIKHGRGGDPRDPDAHACAKDLRKLLVEMDLRMSQFRRSEGLRMQTAETTAREMIKKGDKSPSCCGCWRRAPSSRRSAAGDRKVLDEAVESTSSPQASTR